jgi:CDP-glycerol glycerophosphotransferase
MFGIKINKSALGWGVNRVKKVFGNLFSLCFRCVLPIKKGRVVCWSYDFKQYSCNPRYLTEYILDNDLDFEVYWVFRHRLDVSSIDKRVKYVRRRTWKYFILMNTAEYLVTNVRTDSWKIFWNKRLGQKYMMLWHTFSN